MLMKLKNVKDSWLTCLLNCYIFLFILSMFNREFLPFSIDLRYIQVFIGGILLGIALKRWIFNSERITLSGYAWILIAFYIYLFLNNIQWFFNGLTINLSDFISIMILHASNFLFILNIIIYKDRLEVKQVVNYLIISSTILMLSMFLVWIGFSLPQIMGGDYLGKFVGGEFVNFIGQNMRIAGYAQDPNYASIFLVLTMLVSYYHEDRKVIKWSLIGACIFFYLLAASKTILLGLVFGIIFMLALKQLESLKTGMSHLVSIIYVIGIWVGPYIVLKLMNVLDLGFSSSTMGIRFRMWNIASQLFEQHPFLGNGITSFRASFADTINGWYVQSHSTIFQTISELGLIGLILLIIIFAYIITRKNPFIRNFVIIFLVLCVTYELMYLLVFAFVISVLPLVFEKKQSNPKSEKSLFIINSLGKGGAERVVANIVNKMAELGHQITLIVLYDDIYYKLDQSVEVIKLHQVKEVGKLKKIYNELVTPIKLNQLVHSLEQRDGEYLMITSHLPRTNFYCRLTTITDRCLYVIHGVYSSSETEKNKKILKRILKFLYDNQRVIAVSEGVKLEMIERYHIKTPYIETIYNPIDVKQILKSAEEKLEVPYKYILFCGRLVDIKQPKYLIQAFAKGEFANKGYKLVFLGEGELKRTLIEEAQKLGISYAVQFNGWEDNVYKWMKNASLLVCTSEYESFSMVLVEALCCDCRVVSFDCDFGPREILLGDYAKYLVENQNSEMLAKKMNEALDEYPEDRLNQVYKFDTEIIVNEYLNFASQWT